MKQLIYFWLGVFGVAVILLNNTTQLFKTYDFFYIFTPISLNILGILMFIIAFYYVYFRPMEA